METEKFPQSKMEHANKVVIIFFIIKTSPKLLAKKIAQHRLNCSLIRGSALFQIFLMMNSMIIQNTRYFKEQFVPIYLVMIIGRK